MNLIDTHTHLYMAEFNADRDAVIKNALGHQVGRMLLPNIDSSSLKDMLALTKIFPEYCFPMMGLHPTSVKDNYEKELALITGELACNNYVGIGEIGMDLYWDKNFKSQQADAFRQQLKLAKKYRLAVSIHTRKAFDITLKIVKEELTDNLKGVFHCFTGTIEEAEKIMNTGFKMGIGGIVTFKNAGLARVVYGLPIEQLVLETDAPYLTPAPFRGKRNQSAYLRFVAEKIADIKNITLQEVAEITSYTAESLFFK